MEEMKEMEKREKKKGLEVNSKKFFLQWIKIIEDLTLANITMFHAATATDKDIADWFTAIDKAIVDFRHLRTISVLHFKRCQRFNDNVKK